MGQISRKQQLVFLLFNILYFCMGAGMIGVGLYNILVLQSFGQFGQSYYITGGVLFVIVGVVKVLISLLGILGLVLGKRVVIAIYVLVLGFTILPTLAAGIYGLQQWFYVFNEVGGAMNAVFNNPQQFNGTAQLRATFRQRYDCCGIRDGTLSDYNSTLIVIDATIVQACENARQVRLVNNTDIATQLGCQWYISDDIRFHLYYIGGIGLGFGFFELTSLLVGMQNMEGVI